MKIIVIVFIGVLGVAMYKMFTSTADVAAPKAQVSSKLRNNVFLEPITYNEIKTRSSCKDELEKCQQLGLDSNLGEGLVYQDNSLFIFLKPERHAIDPIFLPIKDNSERDILISLYYLMRSPIMSSYQEGTLDEVQLVFLSADGSPKMVYRLHQYGHSFQSLSLSETLVSLHKAISTNDSKILWDTLGTPLPKLRLIH